MSSPLLSLQYINELQSLDPLWAGNTPVGLPPSQAGLLCICRPANIRRFGSFRYDFWVFCFGVGAQILVSGVAKLPWDHRVVSLRLWSRRGFSLRTPHKLMLRSRRTQIFSRLFVPCIGAREFSADFSFHASAQQYFYLKVSYSQCTDL